MLVSNLFCKKKMRYKDIYKFPSKKQGIKMIPCLVIVKLQKFILFLKQI